MSRPPVSSSLRGIPRALLISLLAAAPWSSPALPAARGQWTQPELRDFVRDALARDRVEVREPEIRYDADAVRADFGSVDLGENPGPWGFPLRAQFTVELIRKTRSAPEQQRNWEPTLQRAEAVIARELDLLRHAHEKMAQEGADRWEIEEKLKKDLIGYDRYFDRILWSLLDRIAEGRGQVALPILDERYAEFVPCTVQVVTVPEGASVYYLPEFMFRFLDRKGLTKEPENWHELLTGKVELAGNYRFYARWSDLGKTKITGTVSIKDDLTLTLRP